MSNAQRTEMVFVSNRTGPAAAPPKGHAGRAPGTALARLGDRIEQMEFTLGEALARDSADTAMAEALADLSDRVENLSNQVSQISDQPLDVTERLDQLWKELRTTSATRREDAAAQLARFTALSGLPGRMDTMARKMSQITESTGPLTSLKGEILSLLNGITGRLDVIERAQGEHSKSLAARLDALDRTLQGRVAPIEKLLGKLASGSERQEQVVSAVAARIKPMDAAMAKLSSGFATQERAIGDLANRVSDEVAPVAALLTATDDKIAATANDAAETRSMLGRVFALLEALPEPHDPTGDLAGISAQIAELPAPIDHSVAMTSMATRISALEADLLSETRRLAEAAETLASRPAAGPDNRPQREVMARYTKTLKSIADRNETQMAELIARVGTVDEKLRSVAGAGAVEALQSGIGTGLDKLRQPLVTRMDAMTGMIATLSNDMRLAQEATIDPGRMTEPLMSRLDRLETLAEQRQREVLGDIKVLASREIPMPDLAPMREAMAEFNAHLQSLQKDGGVALAGLAKKVEALGQQIDAMPAVAVPSDLSQINEQLQPLTGDVAAIARQIDEMSGQLAPGLDLDPLRNAVDQITAGLEEARQGGDAAIDALSVKLDALSHLVTTMASSPEPTQFARIEDEISELRAQLHSTDAGVRALGDRADFDADLSMLKNGNSEQTALMTALMARQDKVHETLSELLQGIVGNHDGLDAEALTENLKTLIAASQFTARRQIEAVEARLSGQIGTIVDALSGPNEEFDETVLAKPA